MRGRQEQIIVTRPVRTRQSHHMESSRSNSGSTIPTQGEHLYIGEWKVERVEGCHSEWVSLSQEVKWTLSVSWSNGKLCGQMLWVLFSGTLASIGLEHIYVFWSIFGGKLWRLRVCFTNFMQKNLFKNPAMKAFPPSNNLGLWMN